MLHIVVSVSKDWHNILFVCLFVCLLAKYLTDHLMDVNETPRATSVDVYLHLINF